MDDDKLEKSLFEALKEINDTQPPSTLRGDELWETLWEVWIIARRAIAEYVLESLEENRCNHDWSRIYLDRYVFKCANCGELISTAEK